VGEAQSRMKSIKTKPKTEFGLTIPIIVAYYLADLVLEVTELGKDKVLIHVL
jgi:hypothetical protein